LVIDKVDTKPAFYATSLSIQNIQTHKNNNRCCYFGGFRRAAMTKSIPKHVPPSSAALALTSSSMTPTRRRIALAVAASKPPPPRLPFSPSPAPTAPPAPPTPPAPPRTTRCCLATASCFSAHFLVRTAGNAATSTTSSPSCSGTSRITSRKQTLHPGYHISGSRVETRRFQAMRLLNSTCTTQPSAPTASRYQLRGNSR
jgi:hypothetical protein